MCWGEGGAENGSGQPMTGPASDTGHESESTPDIVWRARTQRLDGPETWDRTKYDGKKRKRKINVMIPNDILLYS